MTFIVGLTGGIGSGKTTVANRLAQLGAGVVDTDEIARGITRPGGEAMPRIREAFGEAYVTAEGALDRAAMRALAFADPSARARLEAILHPAIRRVVDAELASVRGAYALVVVPLLFESGNYARRASRVLVVDCPPGLQLERTMARSSLAADEVRAIMAAQWPRWRRLQMADDVVWNGGDVAALETQCAQVHDAYLRRAAFAQGNLST
ncbi:MAG TPA: dephospho-CoA kinase [Usitatibacter sp.]|nr:dephospho-CoA kinase [Usitatibacter sp.]